MFCPINVYFLDAWGLVGFWKKKNKNQKTNLIEAAFKATFFFFLTIYQTSLLC